jgi:type 1 glutamine amidotransferase
MLKYFSSLKKWLVVYLLLLSFMSSMSLCAAVSDEQKKLVEKALPKSANLAQKRKLLVFSKSFGFKHPSTELGIYAIEEMARKTGDFEVTLTESSADFNLDYLNKFDALVFNNNTQIQKFLTTSEQKHAFENYIKQGGGFVGVHAASDGGWEEFTNIIGGRFAGHPWTSDGTWSFVNEDPDCPCNTHLASTFKLKDEIYRYKKFDRSKVRVTLALDFSDRDTVDKDPKYDDIPVSWIRKYGKGRVFYTNLGHHHSTWKNADFLKHLYSGILIATGDIKADHVE